MVNSMTENAQNDALSAIIGRLGSLTESELRQLYQVIGIRLGYPDGAVPSGVKTGGGNSTSAKRGKTPQGKKTGGSGKAAAKGKNASSKGNPQRKSQWANHPLYTEYSRLKKVVESQAKEKKLSFSAVDTAESSAYKKVLTQWVEAKSSFRDRKAATNEETSEPEVGDGTEATAEEGSSSVATGPG